MRAVAWARVYSSSLSRMGMRWAGPGVGCWASSRLVVLTHFADGQGCAVGEDVSAGGGGVVEQSQEQMVGADLLMPEQGRLAQAGFEGLLRLRGEWDVPRGRGGSRRCGVTRELALECRGGDAPCGQRCRSGAAGVEDPNEQVFGADGVLVVGAGGGGGEDDHLSGLIGESFEHHDALPPWASPRATRSAAEFPAAHSGRVQVVMGGIDATSALAAVMLL